MKYWVKFDHQERDGYRGYVEIILTSRLYNAVAGYPRTAASSPQRQKSIRQLPLSDFLNPTGWCSYPNGLDSSASQACPRGSRFFII